MPRQYSQCIQSVSAANVDIYMKTRASMSRFVLLAVIKRLLDTPLLLLDVQCYHISRIRN